MYVHILLCSVLACDEIIESPCCAAHCERELEVLESHFIMRETHYFTCTMPASQGERIHVSLLNDTHESY